jgi:hypothetical protein
MSWFRHMPHRREQTRSQPQPSGTTSEVLQQEIELNRQRLEQYRKQTQDKGRKGSWTP